MSPEYLAGFFDGEGCIDCQRMYPKQNPGILYVRPRIRVAQVETARLVLDLLQKEYGGFIYRREHKKENQNPSVSWEILDKVGMIKLIYAMLPHLIVKKEQAKLVLWWLDNASGRYSGKGHRPDMTQARQLFSDELKAMKSDPQRLSERAVAAIEPLMR